MTSVVADVRNYSVRLHTRAGSIHVVDDVSWSVRRGETLALVGESGSGKTVSLMALLGLLPAYVTCETNGSALLNGRDLLRMSGSELQRVRGAEVGVVFQDPLAAFNPGRRLGPQIAEPVRRHLRLHREEARRRAIDVMAEVRLPDPQNLYDAYPHELSGGMRQRALIAMAIAAGPSLLIADEPTSALDVTTQAQLLNLLGWLQRERQMAMILVSHDMGVVAAIADQVAVMYAGRIVEYGESRSVLKAPDHPYTRGLLESIPDARATRGSYFRALPGTPPDLAAVGDGCRFADRCQFALDRCIRARPRLEAVLETGRQGGTMHASSCWRHPSVRVEARAGGTE
jgi:oligopeptide/dipeptide ABC transporter ATP-binding protein